MDDVSAALLESLRDPPHRAAVNPLRRKMLKLLKRRFGRQQRAVLKQSRTWLRWLAEKYSEAEVDPAAKLAQIRQTVKVNLEAGNALTGPTDSETETWDSLLGDAAAAGVRTVSVDVAVGTARDLANNFTAKYLKDRGFQKLAKDVDDTTRERLANAVSDVYAKGGSYADAVQAIKDTFTAASDSRAEMIATTELSDAYNGAMLASGKDAGYAYKQWNLGAEGCPICQANAAQGPIPIDEAFQSGDDAPAAHPRCACSVSFSREP